MCRKREPKYTANIQQYQTNISQYPNIKRSFVTNYETDEEKQQFGFKPPKGEKLYILQKLKWRIFVATKKPIISFLPNHPRTSKSDKKYERTP